MEVRTKRIIFKIFLVIIIFVVSILPTIAQNFFELGIEEIKISKELKEGQVISYDIELGINVYAISYYIRSPNASICWLRLYDSGGRSIYKKDFGQLFSRFIGRSESQIIQNLTSSKYTLEIIAPSYQFCHYELYLKGLTKEQLISIPDTAFYKINQELIKKENTINSLNLQINQLKQELNNSIQKIQNLNKEKDEMNKQITTLINEKHNAERKINLLYYISIILFITNLIILFYFYKNKSKTKKLKSKP